MKNILIITALLALPVTALFATETGEDIIDLPAHTLHYGTPTPVLNIEFVPELPKSISGIEGYVLLQFEITKSGRVSNVEVLKSSHEKLAKFSKGMVRKWTFDNPGDQVTAKQPIIFEVSSDRPNLLALR